MHINMIQTTHRRKQKENQIECNIVKNKNFKFEHFSFQLAR